jgi:hypothetical protein
MGRTRRNLRALAKRHLLDNNYLRLRVAARLFWNFNSFGFGPGVG